MRDLLILLVHLIATLARLLGPGGLRSVVAESLLVKQQLLILNRSRQRAPNLRASDRILAGVCALFMRPARVLRSAVVLRPSTILDFHRMPRRRKYRWLLPRRGLGGTSPGGALRGVFCTDYCPTPRRWLHGAAQNWNLTWRASGRGWALGAWVADRPVPPSHTRRAMPFPSSRRLRTRIAPRAVERSNQRSPNLPVRARRGRPRRPLAVGP